MSVPGVSESMARVAALTQVVINATRMEVRVAALALAMTVREWHPEAVRLVLVHSDQGDWLDVNEWEDAAGERGEFEDNDALGWHLYESHLSAVPGLAQDGRLGFTLDVQAVLDAGLELDAALVEVIVVRDPDGGTDVTVLIAGEQLDADEYLVDAGAGWVWEDWAQHRDDCLASSSPKARQVLLEAFTEPPGGNYVTDRGERLWLDGVAEQ